MLNLEIVQGCQESYDLRANLTDGSPTSDLLITDDYDAVVWQGGNQVALFHPAVAFLDQTSVTMTVTEAESASLNYNEVYLAEIYRSRAMIRNCIGMVLLVCLPAPS